MDTTKLQEALNAVQEHIIDRRRRFPASVATMRHAHSRCLDIMKALNKVTPPAVAYGRSEAALIDARATQLLQLAACAVRAVVDLGYPIPWPPKDATAGAGPCPPDNHTTAPPPLVAGNDD